MVSVNSVKLELADLPAEIDFKYYKEIHYYLFSQLYDWAGTVRKINMGKKQTNFCSYEQIEGTG